MQVAALRKIGRRARFTTVAALALALVVGSLGCGGSSNDEQVILPPGGIAIGELVCNIASSVPGDTVVQGEVITVTFRLTDVNQRVVGQFLPVSFEVMGGHVLNPPDVTDENGDVTVTFVVDADHLGEAFVRLIQPEYDLRCDITFRVVEAACTISFTLLDENASVIPGAACGATGVHFTHDVTRTLIYTLTRPDPNTGLATPVEGAFLLVTVEGQVPGTFELGPSDADGRITVVVGPGGDIELNPQQVGLVTLTAELLIGDVNADGSPDSLPCNTCVIGFEVSAAPCDEMGSFVAVDYFEADGDARAMDVLRPGEYAMLTLTLMRDGQPVANEDMQVTAQNGALNGSALPITVTTDGMGQAVVRYDPMPGYGGTMMAPELDDIVFEAASLTLECTVTTQVAVATCGIDLDFAATPTQGVPVAVEVTVLYVDPATADGEEVSLSATGGTLSPPQDTIGPLAGTMRTITYTPSAAATGGSISLSFVDGYPCNTKTETFTVAP